MKLVVVFFVNFDRTVTPNTWVLTGIEHKYSDETFYFNVDNANSVRVRIIGCVD